MPSLRVALPVAVLWATFLLAPSASGAADFAVSTGADDGPGSLRMAITEANTSAGHDRIVFSGPQTVTASSPLPTITEAVSVDGAGGRLAGSDLRASASPVVLTRLGLVAPASFQPGDGAPAAPGALRLRRGSDGRLALTGTSGAGGSVEVFREGGAAFAGVAGDIAGGGPFGFGALPFDVAEGGTFTASVTAAGGTSRFGEPQSIADLTSPTLVGGRTLDATGDGLVDTLRLRFSERLSDASGTGGLTLGGPAAPTLGSIATGPAADDEELDAVLATPLPGDAVPALSVAANGSLTDAAGNFALAATPPVAPVDGVAPRVLEAVAVSRSSVRVRFGEPVVPASVEAGDFAVSINGADRAISRMSLAADARSAELVSSTEWAYGAAGTLRLTGTLTDRAGNVTPAGSPPVRIYAAPGDATAPTLTAVSMSPRVVCVKKISRRCSREGSTVSFTVSEPVTVTLSLRRLKSRATSTVDDDVEAGKGTMRFAGRVEGRVLRVGQYRLTVTAADAAGNEAKPVTLSFRVRR